MGNDFELPDVVWQQGLEGWKVAKPFPRFSKHTMGFSTADINNDGVINIADIIALLAMRK